MSKIIAENVFSILDAHWQIDCFVVRRMKVVTVGIYARLVRSVLFVEFLDEKPVALGAILVYRFKVAYEIACRIVCTAVEFFSSAFGLSCNYLAIATWHRAFCQRNGFRVVALGKS